MTIWTLFTQRRESLLNAHHEARNVRARHRLAQSGLRQADDRRRADRHRRGEHDQFRRRGASATSPPRRRNNVVGSDPFDIEDLWQRMFRNDFWRGGVVAYTGISAVEIACWDIVGKALGVPCWKLLGGKVRSALKAYANGWYQVEHTPEAIAEATKKVLKRGYRALKLDPFGAGGYELSREEFQQSIAIVEAVREAVGPEVEILIEMHGRFSPATAATVSRATGAAAADLRRRAGAAGKHGRSQAGGRSDPRFRSRPASAASPGTATRSCWRPERST